jgi:hypothetical protein
MHAQKYARFRSKIKMGYTKLGSKYITLFFWPISVKIEPSKCPANHFSHSEQKMHAQKYARFRSKKNGIYKAWMEILHTTFFGRFRSKLSRPNALKISFLTVNKTTPHKNMPDFGQK